MSNQKRESYEIDRNEPTHQFLRARAVAGAILEAQFKKEVGKVEPSKDYRWIKAELTWPSFDHLTFGYGNQIFSVLVEVTDGQQSSLTQRDRNRCSEVALENNLIPCVFPVDSTAMRPLADGWNLIHLVDHGQVIPGERATDERIPMSEWELRNFAIQIVRNHLEEKLNVKVLSFCDVMGIDPQIWFEDAEGARQWVIVRHYRLIHGNEKQEFIGSERSNAQLRPYDGHFAAVSFASSEPFLYDLDGSHIPLSKRFDGSAPLYRGDGFYIKFDGIQRIYVS